MLAIHHKHAISGLRRAIQRANSILGTRCHVFAHQQALRVVACRGGSYEEETSNMLASALLLLGFPKRQEVGGL